jgi:uridylate kinase
MKKSLNKFKWNKILLKISGESLMGDDSFGINSTVVQSFANQIQKVVSSGLQICIVVGGGNIYRGISGTNNGMDRATGDYMGMLATVMNSLAIQNALEQTGVQTRVQSALPISAVCEPYIRRRAKRHMEKGRVVIFAAGTGNPYFTTDTAAALRASEMNCDAIIKATLVDGVYSADPKKDENAIKYDRLSYLDVLSKDLRVMDASAISLARENKIPIIVCSIIEDGNLTKVLNGQGSYTLITD